MGLGHTVISEIAKICCRSIQLDASTEITECGGNYCDVVDGARSRHLMCQDGSV